MNRPFTQSRSQVQIIHSTRLGFFLVLLFGFISTQWLQPRFVSPETSVHWFATLTGAFFLQSIFFWNFERFFASQVANIILFIFDSVFITTLLATTGVRTSILFFSYLLNIVLGGFVFGRKGALLLAVVALGGFLAVQTSSESIANRSTFAVVIFNVFAFLVVGWLSGYLSEQLNFMGVDRDRLNELNELVFNYVGTGLMTVDEYGEVIHINPAGRTILGLEKEITNTSVGVIWAEFWREFKRHREDAPAVSLRRFDVHFSVDRIGKICNCLVSEIRDNENHVGCIVLFDDRTQERRLEASLRQNEKLAAVGALASGIAHEIRNPLASISGSIQLLNTYASAKDEEATRLMKISLKEIDRLNGLITEFLEFVKPENIPTTPVDLSAVIREVAEIVRVNPAVRKDVAQIFEIDPNVQITGSFDKLKQAILNIVLNAYQAMQETPAAPEIRFIIKHISQAEGHPARVVLSIKDNGPGMEEKTLKRLFEPFHTTKARGTGLGLAVTHKILQSHGAQIFVYSKKDQGAEFRIEFPELPLTKRVATMNEGRAS